MRDIAENVLGVLIGFVIISLLTKISPSVAISFNIFSLVIVYFALRKGEIWGACLGMICGLIHDSFAIGVFGIMGMSKTLTGYLAGYVSRKINVQPWNRQAVFLFSLLALELGIWILLLSFIFDAPPIPEQRILLLQPLLTTGLGSLIFPGIRAVRKRMDPHRHAT